MNPTLTPVISEKQSVSKRRRRCEKQRRLSAAARKVRAHAKKCWRVLLPRRHLRPGKPFLDEDFEELGRQSIFCCLCRRNLAAPA